MTEVLPAGFLARAMIGIMVLLALDSTYREGSTRLDHAGRDVLADEVRSVIAGALTGSGADDCSACSGSSSHGHRPASRRYRRW